MVSKKENIIFFSSTKIIYFVCLHSCFKGENFSTSDRSVLVYRDYKVEVAHEFLLSNVTKL